MRRRRRRGTGGGWYPRTEKLPPPEHGIKLKKAGVTWWGQRWIEALEKLSWDYSNRLARGRTYARAGRVHDLQIKGGKVIARVTGSRATPYRVTIEVAPLATEHWEAAIAQMARQALFATKLLAGEMPPEIDQAFHAADVSLFPAQAADLRTDCSCPDWANPCKHVAATHYLLGEAFDKDPFLLFELRGRGREQVLGALDRERSGGQREPAAGVKSQPAVEPVSAVRLSGIAPEDFERARAATGTMGFRIEAPALAGALLRQIGPPPSWAIEESPMDLLGPLYAAAGALAREIAVSLLEEAPEGPQKPSERRVR